MNNQRVPYVVWIVSIVAAGAALRYALGLVAIVSWARRGRLDRLTNGDLPPISLVKPLYGAAPGLEANLEATLRQNYPEFEVLFAYERPDDPALPPARAAVAAVQATTQAGSDIAITWVNERTDATNPKVAVLVPAVARASYDIVVAADDDVRPDPLYLRDIAAALENADAVSMAPVLVGTKTWPTRLAALAVNTDGLSSIVLARGRAVTGSTIGLTRTALEKSGGWATVAQHIADDYSFGQVLHRAGCRVALARRPARLDSPGGTLGETASWMLRWARTVKSAAPLWFFTAALFSVSPLVLLVLGCLTPFKAVAFTLLATITLLRAAIAFVVEIRFCRDTTMARAIPLLPLLWFVEPWGLFRALLGNTVVWRGRRYRLRQGRAEPVT